MRSPREKRFRAGGPARGHNTKSKHMSRPVWRSCCAGAFVLLRLLMQLAGTGALVHSQAWAPPKGQGAVTFSFQRIDNTGHRLSDGFLLERFQSVNMSAYLEAEYALTNRFSVSAGLPYVFTKFVDPNSTPPGVLPLLPKDQCRCWHSGPQDFGFTAR